MPGKVKCSVSNVLELVGASESEVKGFSSESDGEFRPYCYEGSSDNDNNKLVEGDHGAKEKETQNVNGLQMMIFHCQK